MMKYRDLIAAAVGFNMERGDHITVENISFESDENFTAAEPTFIEKQGPVIVHGPSVSDRSDHIHPGLPALP